MKKNVLSLSIAAMIGGLGFAGAAWTEQRAQKLRFALAEPLGAPVMAAMRMGLLRSMFGPLAEDRND